MGYRRAKLASRRYLRGRASGVDVLQAALTDVAHELITKYSRRRRGGQAPRQALIEGLSDVTEEVIGVRVPTGGRRKAQAQPSRVQPSAAAPERDPELDRIEELKKFVDGS